jgi:hypothetical protein
MSQSYTDWKPIVEICFQFFFFFFFLGFFWFPMQSPSVEMLQILIMMLHTSLNLSTLLKPWRIIVQFGSSCAELQLKIHYTNPAFVWMLNVGDQLGKIFVVKASGSVEEEEVLHVFNQILQSENSLKLQTVWKLSEIADNLKTIWNFRITWKQCEVANNLLEVKKWVCMFWVWGFWDWLSSEEQTTTWY